MSNQGITAGDQIRVNLKCKVNQSGIMRGERNGREVIIVPSATLPDDIVMNGVKYPANEIEMSFRTLNRTPAPLGHPQDSDGEFLSASDVEAINGYYFGAFNDNARRRDGRVFVDKVIDVKRAEESEMGRRVLEAINQGDPIHTSTGLLCSIDEAGADDGCEFIARNIYFDHDAILLDEDGAATPEQGVGMLVNKARGKDGNEISAFGFEIDGVDEALSEPQKVGLVHMIKSALSELISPERKPETNSNEVDMSDSVTKAQFDELSAKVNKLAEDFGNLDIEAALTNALKPLTAQVESIVNKDKAAAEAKHKSLVERVVNQNLLDKDVADKTPEAALEAMLANAGKGTAAPIIGGFSGSGKESKIELPED